MLQKTNEEVIYKWYLKISRNLTKKKPEVFNSAVISILKNINEEAIKEALIALKKLTVNQFINLEGNNHVLLQ